MLGPLGAGLCVSQAWHLPSPAQEQTPSQARPLPGLWASVLSGSWSCSCTCLGALSLLPRLWSKRALCRRP